MIDKDANEILEEWKSLARDYAAEIQRGDAKCRELQTEIERLRAICTKAKEALYAGTMDDFEVAEMLEAATQGGG